MRPTLLPIKFLDVETCDRHGGRPCASTRAGTPRRTARFAGERSRPFADLVAQVRADDPQLVVDLGCGHGPPTLTLAELLAGRPGRRGRLLARRCSSRPGELDPDGRVEWVQSDLREWDPASLGQAPDVVVTSSTLQWVPGHLDLLDAWVEALADGGWFALQVPGNFDAPSHRLMRETAEHHERAGELAAALDLPAVGEPATYLRYLSRLGCDVDAWETTYLHVLDPDGEDENPVLTWVAAHRAAAGHRHPHRRGRARRVPRRRTPRRSPTPTRARRRGCSSRSGGCSPWRRKAPRAAA